MKKKCSFELTTGRSIASYRPDTLVGQTGEESFAKSNFSFLKKERKKVSEGKREEEYAVRLLS